jgi:hypothetical protein
VEVAEVANTSEPRYVVEDGYVWMYIGSAKFQLVPVNSAARHLLSASMSGQ